MCGEVRRAARGQPVKTAGSRNRRSAASSSSAVRDRGGGKLPHGIRANAAGPGFIDDTGMTEATRANEEATHAVAGRTLLGRFGRPREVADAVLFLAGEESSYFTGSILYPDGGFSAPSR